MGLTFNQPQTIQEILLDWDTTPKEKKPSPEVTFAEDPIALSWASYHVWQKFPSRRWVSLNDVEAHAHDREIADATRRYYRDRYTMDVLKGKQLTEFQTTLYGIISGEVPILQDQIGIIMKIPYFYAEDVTLDHIFANTKSVARESMVAETREDTITPYSYTFASRKKFETHQYWFTDSEGRTTLWSVQTSNPLASVIKSLYQRKQPLKIRANWHYARQRGPRADHVHWNLGGVELL